jgi:hypothetical protein
MKTPDIYLAAYLKAKDYQLLTVEKDGRKAIFVFDGPQEQLDKEVQSYKDNQGQVVALKYADEVKRLKKIAINL